MIEVTAAVIADKDRFLICRRPMEKSQGGLWEFPGGKIEPGETAEECIIRECREELGVEIMVTGKLADVIYEYPDKTVHLQFFKANIEAGELTLIEHMEFAMITPEETGKYTFCPADRKMLTDTQMRGLFDAPEC